MRIFPDSTSLKARLPARRRRSSRITRTETIRQRPAVRSTTRARTTRAWLRSIWRGIRARRAKMSTSALTNARRRRVCASSCGKAVYCPTETRAARKLPPAPQRTGEGLSCRRYSKFWRVCRAKIFVFLGKIIGKFETFANFKKSLIYPLARPNGV